MKQCPDCGFRAKDDICPLCGVRMKSTSAVSLGTHDHSRKGEACLLPQKEEKRMKFPTARERQRHNTGGDPSGKLMSSVAVVILIILMRACSV